MELTLLAARLLLAAVFLLAGVTKLVDRNGSNKALSDFGLPPGLAQTMSLLLSTGEIAVAVALLPVASAWYGACGALALLTIFVIGISVNLARGRRPDCRCFGQLHSAPVGWSTLIRNGILAAPAVWLVSRGRLQSGPSLWAHLVATDATERRVLIVAACVAYVLFFRALRSGRRVEAESVATEPLFGWESEPEEESQRTPEVDRAQPVPERPAPRQMTPVRSVNTAPSPKPQPGGPEPQKILPKGIGLPVGTRAPEFALPSLTGQRRSLGSFREQGKTIFLVFSSPHCEACKVVLPHISRWTREHGDLLNTVLVTGGSAKENMARLKDFETSRVLLQQDFEVAEAYDCTGTPAAVLIGADGLIQSALAVGGVAIEQLIATSLSKLDSGPVREKSGAQDSLQATESMRSTSIDR